ncbi:MAG TPA: PadR family transcriptional regulator, partial [Pseudonocardia sp.]|nr:PadR family transcriptional regulator [Pseudonocardia sp.]
RRELGVLQAEAFEEVRFPPDPVDLALATATGVDEGTLRGHLEDRTRDLTARLSRLDHLAERRWPDQTPADDLVLEHARLRLRAELEWHGLVRGQLGEIGAEP